MMSKIVSLLVIMDIGEDGQLGFQDAATTVMAGIVNFYNYVFIYLVYVVILVMYMLIEILRNFSQSKRAISHKYMAHGTLIELI